MTVAACAILLVAIGFLIFCSALCSGLETALFSLKQHQLQRLEQHHLALTKFVQLFRENPRKVLHCLVLPWRGTFAGRIPQWLAAVVIFAVVVLFCDLIPKLLALSAPYRLSTVGALALKMSLPLLDRVGSSLE